MAIAPPPISDSPEARRYNRLARRINIADAVLGFALLAVLLLTGWTKTLSHVSLRITGESPILGLLVYVFFLLVIARVLSLGFDYYSFRLEHRFHLSNQKLRSWLWDEVKGFAVSLVISVLLTQLLYALIRWDSQTWWLWAWAAFMVLMIVFAQLAPIVLFPIFYRFKPLDNDGLRDRLTKLSERAGTKVRGVYEWELSEKTKKANAALMGLGATRRIVLADNLLAGYSDDEIEAVLAHELGHHVHRHIFKSIAVQAIVTLIGFWVVKWVVSYSVTSDWFAYKADFANLPLIVLVSSLMSLALLPVLNAYSCFNERQADRYAWKSIPHIEPFISSMNKLAEQNLAERNPSRIVELLFHSHPPISRRVAAAQAWAKR